MQSHFKHCPVCLSDEVDEISLNTSTFRHLDFQIFDSGSNCLARCGHCSTVFRLGGSTTTVSIDDIYRSTEYATDRANVHAVFVDDFPSPVSPFFLQSRILLDLLPKASPKILDIGCFDGSLLEELDKQLEGAYLCGFDVNDNMRNMFPAGSNFRFCVGDLELVKGRFDLIVMSHSMQYVHNIPYLMQNLQRLLKSNGLVFIQVPDFSIKPCSILFGDTHYHYTYDILHNIFGSYGFTLCKKDNSWFPRDLLAVAKTDSSDELILRKDRTIYECVDYLECVKEKLNQLKHSGNIAILGTTIEAAFASSVLGSVVKCYVDENPNKVGTLFNGLRVIHPRKLTDDDTVVLPYGPTAGNMKEKFETHYLGEFICV